MAGVRAAGYTEAMTYRYEAEDRELTAWAHQTASALGLEPLEKCELDLVLSSAAQVSSELVRSAGPVAMYLAGLLVATGRASDVSGACRMVGSVIRTPEVIARLNEFEDSPERIRD